MGDIHRQTIKKKRREKRANHDYTSELREFIDWADATMTSIDIAELERFAGLPPGAYVSSKEEDETILRTLKSMMFMAVQIHGYAPVIKKL